MSRSRHPNKHIENAVAYAEACGWRYVEAGGSTHAWRRMLCVHAIATDASSLCIPRLASQRIMPVKSAAKSMRAVTEQVPKCTARNVVHEPTRILFRSHLERPH